MKASFSRSLPNLFLGLLLLILLAGFVFSYQRIMTSRSARLYLKQTDSLNFRLNQLLFTITSAESNERGFLLSHNRNFLSTYENLDRQANTIGSSLSHLTSSEPAQSAKVTKLMGFVSMRFQLMDNTLHQTHEGNESMLTESKSLETGSALSDSIRMTAESLTADRNEVATLKSKDLTSIKGPSNFLFFSAVTILVLTGIVALFLYEKRQRDRAEQRELKIKLLQNEMEQRVIDRTRELNYANEAIVAKNLILSQNNAELSAFSYIASHDLQEPLRKIQTYSSYIRETESGLLSEKSAHYLERLESSAARMKALLAALLNYSRLSNTGTAKERTDLNRVADEVIGNLQEMIEEKKAVISRDHLPVIMGLPLQFDQLFFNLISNSLKYSKSDVPPVIRIGCISLPKEEIRQLGNFPEKNYYRISITDNGIGFESQYAEKIFELFQRLHGKTEYAGTGIGLSICYKIVQNHQGAITAAGAPGQGARFDIYLPMPVI